MSSADRWSSKFHSCLRSFASRPTVHLSDNVSAVDIISSDILAAGRGLFAKYQQGKEDIRQYQHLSFTRKAREILESPDLEKALNLICYKICHKCLNFFS